MPPKPRCSDEDFIHLYKTIGPRATAKQLNCHLRKVHERRARLEKSRGIKIYSPINPQERGEEHPARYQLDIAEGVVLIGSDSHYWPGVVSTAHRAFVHFCKRMKPKAVIKNGDELDGATISRFPKMDWEDKPPLVLELEACKDRLGEITSAAGKAHRIWPLGNHDARYESRLANVAPEYANVHGVHLKDHFPDWEPCWSVWINGDVVVKHRYRGGIHATRNNTLNAGRSMVTGHLHSLKVTPLTDYNGTRWGVDCGTLAHPFGGQFDYLEDSPRDWRSGFVLLTFRGGKLLWPEVIHVVDERAGIVEFRGDLINV